MDTIEGEKVWKDWFQPYFDMIRREPTIKAFVYINRNWAPTRWPKWGDGRIEKNPLIQKRIQEEMNQPFYIHQFPTRESFLEILKTVQ